MPTLNEQLRGQSPLIPLDCEEFITRPIPERRTIMAPWLPDKGLGMLHSPRGMGKTRFGASAAYHIALGTDWLGFTVQQPRKVLYLDGKMPAAAMQNLLKEISAGSPEKPQQGYFRILSSDLSERGIPDLATPEGQERIDGIIGDAELIVLDNLSTLFRTGKENESESWISTQEWLLAKRRDGRSVLFIHHTGKKGAQRGTSKREDVLDTVIALRHPDGYSPEQGARFEVHFEKSRGFTGPDATPFEARMRTHEGRAVWERSPIGGGKRVDVLNYLRDGGSVRGAEKQFGIPKSTVARMKQEADASPATETVVPLSQH